MLSIIFNQLVGTLNLWTSVPAFLLYYLLYTSSERDNPEGMIRDIKVHIFSFLFINRLIRNLFLLNEKNIAALNPFKFLK